MIRKFAASLLLALLAFSTDPSVARDKAVKPAPAKPVTVQIIGFNDFHGNIEPPKQTVIIEQPSGDVVQVPAGGAAYLASAIDRYRAKNPNTLVLSAGDMISASPITSSLFLDEPSIEVMSRIGVDYNALGNHEFDRGRQELLRMQYGGCAKFTVRAPCQVEKHFRGAQFPFLAANVVTETGKTLFPATAIRTFGKGPNAVKVGIIGLPLRDILTLASPSGLTGLQFRDEAETINALVPKLKAQGADAIVVLIHQGLYTKVGYNDKSCGGVSYRLLNILAKLDPRVDLVVSGHTHQAYICDYGKIDPSRPFLVTSAGLWGEFITDIDLTIDPATRRVTHKDANNIIVQSEPYTGTTGYHGLVPQFEEFPARPDIAAYVQRYVDAVRVFKERTIGKISAPATKPDSLIQESGLGNLIADAQLAATRPVGAQFALMNNAGVRADLHEGGDGSVTFGALFTVQPFSNELKTLTLTGQQIKALLEQEFGARGFDETFSTSAGFTFSFDRSRPLGSRVSDIMLDGRPIDPARDYRLTMNAFLEAGGDQFTVFRDGRDVVTSEQDLDALEQWISAVPVRELPPLGRVRDLSPESMKTLKFVP